MTQFVRYAVILLAAIAGRTSFASDCYSEALGLAGIHIAVTADHYMYAKNSYRTVEEIAQVLGRLPRSCPVLLIAAEPSGVPRATELCKVLFGMKFEKLLVDVRGPQQGWTAYPLGASCTPIGVSK
jgi:hypothetical protein